MAKYLYRLRMGICAETLIRFSRRDKHEMIWLQCSLGPIDIHCIQIMAAARWMKPVKFAVRLS